MLASMFATMLAMAVTAHEVPVFEDVRDLPAPIEEEMPAGGYEVPAEATIDEWAGVYADWWEPVPYAAPEPQEWVAAYDTGDGISAQEFQWLGVVSDESHTYTWYSERVLPGGGLDDLNANGRHSDGGFVKDGDGYIAVASCDYEKWTVIDTPFGQAKVYDTGYLAPGQVDVYTSF